jgi:gas vesicle protein
MGQEPEQIRQEIEETRGEMGDTVEALAYRADVKSRVKDSIADKRDRLVERVQGTTGKVSEAAPDGEQLKQGAHRAVGIAEENPIGLALAGVAGGFLAGMLLPSTKMEDERVGPLADQVKETAVDTGKEALDRGREVAGEVAEQAVEGAKEVGQQAVETAKESGQEQAEELKESAKESAQEVSQQAKGTS